MKLKHLLLTALCAVVSVGAWAAEWSIDFSDVGTRNKLADKAGASISAAVLTVWAQ